MTKMKTFYATSLVDLQKEYLQLFKRELIYLEQVQNVGVHPPPIKKKYQGPML